MTEMEKANIRFLLVDFAYLWNNLEDKSRWDEEEIELNFHQVCKLVHTKPEMLGWKYDN